MPTMKMPDSMAGVGSRVTLVLNDRVVVCEVVEAHVNAKIGAVNGEAAFVDDGYLCKFKIVSADVLSAERMTQMKAAMTSALNVDRGARQIEIE